AMASKLRRRDRGRSSKLQAVKREATRPAQLRSTRAVEENRVRLASTPMMSSSDARPTARVAASPFRKSSLRTRRIRERSLSRSGGGSWESVLMILGAPGGPFGGRTSLDENTVSPETPSWIGGLTVRG